MEYNITKWSNLKYSSACSDVIWNARISWSEMEYNLIRWSDLEDFPLFGDARENEKFVFTLEDELKLCGQSRF